MKGKKSNNVIEAFADQFATIPEDMKYSLTYDRGKKMVRHKQFTRDTGINVYFVDSHSPWQRGSCENTNGLIRDFFPKGTDFSKIPYEETKHVQDMLNERVRKTLSFKSPEYMFNKLIGAIKT